MRSDIPSYHHFGTQREMIVQEEHFPSTHFIRYSGYPSPIPSFRVQREIFLALCSFLLLSLKVSHFPLSHIGRYTGVPERSLDFARDDFTEAALSKHIRCSLHEINPFPHTVMRGAARNLPSTLLFLASFRKRFPLFRYHTYGAIPVCQKDPSTSLGMTLRK